MDGQQEVVPDTAGENGIRRRTLLAAGAWSVPVIALVTASPATAASLNLTLVGGGSATIDRCGVLPPGTFTFTAFDNGVPATSGNVVVTLPTGLRFVSGDPTTATLPVGPSGIVLVPAIQAVGSVGTYSITGTYDQLATATNTTTIDAVAGSGFYFGLANNPLNPQGFSSPQLVTAANSDGTYVGVTSTGQVVTWGTAFNQSSPTAVASSPSGVTLVSTDTVHSGSHWYNHTIVANSSNVWISSGDHQAPSFGQMAGYTGSVRDVAAGDGASFVLTSDGLFYNGRSYQDPDDFGLLRGPVPGSNAIADSPTTGKPLWSAWTVHTDRFYSGGGFVTAAGAVYRFGGSQNASTPTVVQTPNPPANIVEFFAGDGAMTALTSTGEVWVYGTAYQSPNAWVKKINSGIVHLASWTRHWNDFYAGGVALDNRGAVINFAQSNDSSWKTGVVGGFPAGTTVVGVYSADGVHAALTSTGDVYRWTSNGASTTATKINGLPGPVTQLYEYGVHAGDGNFYGNGLAIVAAACALP